MKAVLIAATFVAFNASAATLAVATSADGATIALTDEAGPCVGEARLAIWRSPDAKLRVPGCWKNLGPAIHVAFLDGDMAQIPIQELKKPTSL